MVDSGGCNTDGCRLVAAAMLLIIGLGGAAFWAFIVWVNWYYDPERFRRRAARLAEKEKKNAAWPDPPERPKQ